MQLETDKENDTDAKELFFETSRKLGLRLIVYIVSAIVVLAAGKFFWWAGVLLFVILSVYLLSEFLTNGFVLFVAVFTAMVYAVAYSKSKASDKFVAVKNDRFYLVLTNLLFGLFCSSLLGLAGALFVFFFTNFFS